MSIESINDIINSYYKPCDNIPKTKVRLKVKKLHPDAIIPCYAKHDDSGLDIYSIEDIIIQPGDRALIKTGIALQLPANVEAQIRPRSGLALNNGITVLNTPGTIDNGYRNEIGVIIINHGNEVFNITKGFKIAQMVLAPVINVETQVVIELSDTERGMGGFGHTGN